MDSIEAKVLVAILKDVIVCMNLEFNMCHAVRSNKILCDTLDKINK